MRHAGQSDPLKGVHELTSALLEPLRITHAELATAVASDCLEWTAKLEALGHRVESAELLAHAAATLGDRAANTFASAIELKRADLCLSARRPPAACVHALRAFQHAPRYASVRLFERLRDRMHGRKLLRRA
jgi:hypothetical protein